jgi:hypothetical protein
MYRISTEIPTARRDYMRTLKEDPASLAFHTRLMSLQTTCENLARSKTRTSEQIDELIAKAIPPSCHALCEQMQHYFPRELRDMIFQYLLPSSDVLIEASDFTPFEAPDSSRSQLSKSSHLLRPGMSDAQTRQELFEAWYKYSTFQFSSPDLIPRFLHKDLWGLDLPVRKLVRRLVIDIWPPDTLSNTRFSRVVDDPALLACLLSIRTGARIEFPIDTGRYTYIWCRPEEDIREFVVVLTRFSASAKRLLDTGLEVVVEVDGFEVALEYENLRQDAWYERIYEKSRVRSSDYSFCKAELMSL